MAKRLVLACMDRRLNGHLDEKYNNGNTLFLRNAGANAHCLLQSISEAVSEGKIDEILVLGHTDCGAMKVVFDAIVNHNSSYSSAIKDRIIHPFDDFEYLKEVGKKFNAMNQDEKASAEAEARRILEKRNVEMQVGFLKELTKSFPGVKVEGGIINLSNIDVPASDDHLEYSVVFSRECGSKFNDMCNLAHTDPYKTYVLEASSLKEAAPDLQMAVELFHIHDIRLVVPDKSLGASISSDFEWAKSMSSGFLKGSNISIEQD